MQNTDNQEDKITRFISIQKHFKLKQKEFANKVGLTQSKVSLIKNGKAGTNILNEIFYRLHYEFGITKDWWEKGEGNMFLQNVEKNISTAEESPEYWKGRYDQLKEEHERLLKELNDIKRHTKVS